MTKPLALGALLLATSHLFAPAALAQAAAQDSAEQPAAPPTAEDPAQPEDVDISAPGAGQVDEEIVVRGRFVPDVVRVTPEVVSLLSTADIARTGEGDIAGALGRVTGLSIVGNGFVYVRGLGDRYSSSLLNGSPLPSPEPLRRVVPLDIFPTSIVGSALVQKSYSVNYPGEFGGGVINLTTQAVPNETFLELGAGIGIDTVTTGKLGYTYYGSDLDVFGYDDGERSVPGFIKAAGRQNRDVTNPLDLIQLSNARTTLLQRNRDIPPAFNGSINFGTSADVGATRIGAIASFGYDNNWRTRDAIQQATNDREGTPQRDFRTVLTDNRVLVNGLIGIGAEFGDHKTRFSTLYIHDTLKQGRLGSGEVANLDIFQPGTPSFIEQNTNFFERELFDSQFVGEFKFGDLSADVRGSFAQTQRNSPYERFFRYEFDPRAGDYVNRLNAQTSEASVAFNELEERLWSGGIDLTYKLAWDRPTKVSAGYAYSDADRTSSRFTFTYQRPGGVALDPLAAQLRPDFLLSDSVIQNFGIVLRNTSTAQGSAEYDASLRIHGAYVQAETEVIDGLRTVVGVRYEDAVQRVTPTGGFASTRLANNYWLPAATITYNFAEDMQFRLHASKTIARPQFRELAPQLYLDFESDRQFFGNPGLRDSKLYNVEGRFEWFLGREQRLSAAGFYKRIEDPVEAVAFFTGSSTTLQTGFTNAPEATLYGAEIEFQKYFPLDGLGGDFFATRRAVLVANYTYTKSEISAGNQLVPDPVPTLGPPQLVPANLILRDGAKLTGQSDHLVNLQLGFEDTERLSQYTILFSYASNRVTNRGPVAEGVRLPDLFERPGIRLDLVAREAVDFLGREFVIKAEARNLTGTDYREFQRFENGPLFINRWNLGRLYSLSITTRFN